MNLCSEYLWMRAYDTMYVEWMLTYEWMQYKMNTHDMHKMNLNE